MKIISALLIFCANPVLAQFPDWEQRVQTVTQMVEAVRLKNYDQSQKDFTESLKKEFSVERSSAFYQGLFAQYGKLLRLGAPKKTGPGEAVFPAHFERGVLNLKVVFEGERIAGFWFRPRVPELPAPERHETKLHLPFKGKWIVFWGGDSKEQNHHHDTPNQRFAFDFLGVDENGQAHQGTGASNEDYHAFGREILAPADGTVTDVIEGVRDNAPGSMNPYSTLGNAVIVKHAEYEYSVLAHLKMGSIRVKAGEKVRRGRMLGLCGNSGNSSEPHLHYHLQNTPVIQDGTGIKAYFQKIAVMKEGKKKVEPEYSPVKEDIVSPE